jgi:hypothetical protein
VPDWLTLAQTRKAVAAATAAAGVLAAQGLLTGAAQSWVTGCCAAAGAALVLLVPNADPPEPEQHGAHAEDSERLHEGHVRKVGGYSGTRDAADVPPPSSRPPHPGEHRRP